MENEAARQIRLNNQLIQTARGGSAAQAAYLIKEGAQADYNQSAALLWAAVNEDVEMIQILIEAGANPNTHEGEPLGKACTKPKDGGKTAEKLVQLGANPAQAKKWLEKNELKSDLPLLQELLTLQENTEKFWKLNQVHPEVEI